MANYLINDSAFKIFPFKYNATMMDMKIKEVYRARNKIQFIAATEKIGS